MYPLWSQRAGGVSRCMDLVAGTSQEFRCIFIDSIALVVSSIPQVLKCDACCAMSVCHASNTVDGMPSLCTRMNATRPKRFPSWKQL